MENTIEIPAGFEEKKLVVECYLEAGQPFLLMLTETKNYSEVANICPFVRHALVVITHNGIKDTLQEAPYSGSGCSNILPYFSVDSTRFFNYGSNTICPFDYNSEFTLEVWDTLNNRYITAKTQLLPPVPITTFETGFNTDSIAYCLLGCQDDLATEDYYRMTIHKWSLFRKDPNSLFKYVARNPYVDQVMYDQAIFSGGEVVHVSDYDFYRTDSIIATIYHIEKAYHDYLITTRAAGQANLNPFIEPAKVISNIEGGYGIFTFLSYDRDTLYIPW